MTTPRWQHISVLYHEALSRPLELRQGYLREACAGDQVLQREVEALLAADAESALVDMPAINVVAQGIAGAPSLIGRRLGAYEVTKVLGVGGMGEVYEARDTRLDRTVAIKLMPPDVAMDPEFRERFGREARSVSRLDHPHICTLYDVGEHEGTAFLVMQYLEGETLEQRLVKGSIPQRQALEYAIHIAGALDTAHRAGIVHRDLKPGNIMLTKTGAMLLDFGLAKMVAASASAVSTIPTRSPGGTTRGTILGTLSYMTPEQLEGREADARSDLFAFGAVVYEMVTGRCAFAAESQASVIAAILEHDPPAISTLRQPSSPTLERVVTKCLAKDPENRWQTARDLADELTWIAQTDSSLGGAAARVDHARPRYGGRVLGLMALIVAVLAASRFLWPFTREPSQRPLEVTRALVGVAPADQLTPAPTRTAVAFAPDGKHLVYAATKGGRQQLYLRAMDRLEATPMPGTDNSNSPFFSPDGHWVAFWTGQLAPGAQGELKKVPLDGGPAVTLCVTSPLYGASWGSDDRIVFANFRGGLWRVSAGGGTPQLLTTVDASKGEASHRLPHVLPGARAVLFTIERGRWDLAQIVVRVLATGEQRVLVEGGADARYVPTGHLVYGRAGTLMGVPFDLARLEVTGAPIGVVDGVTQAENAPFISLDDTGAAQVSLSESGALVYVPGGIFPTIGTTMTWVDRNGARTPIVTPPGSYMGARLSPDGQRLAVALRGTDANLWLLDLARGTFTRLTAGKELSLWPAWTTDGTQIAWAPAMQGLWLISTDGSGRRERLPLGKNRMAASWSPDGEALAFIKRTEASGNEIWTWTRASGERKLQPPLQAGVDERYPAFSPDGHWLAYATDESGRFQVYVQRYPGSGERQQVSTEGGVQPAWARGGQELLYTVPDRPGTGQRHIKMMSVDMTLSPALRVGASRVLFEGEYTVSTPLRDYDVTPDGQRFVMNQINEHPPAAPLTQMVVVLNWTEELKRRVPAK